MGWGGMCSILREEIFANMQCNLRSLGDFYILQDVETLKQSHAHILVICPYLFCVKNYERSIWRGRQEKFKLPIKAADEEHDSESKELISRDKLLE